LAYNNQGNYKNAVADLTKAIGLAPDNAQAYLLRGTIQLVNRDNQDALTDLTKAIGLAPDARKDIYTGRGVSHVGELLRGHRRFQTGAHLNPSDSLRTRHKTSSIN